MNAPISHAARDLIGHCPPRRAVVIAELGVNHNGHLDLALQLVRAAAESGADAVKLQLFEPRQLCSARYRRAEIDMLTPLALSRQAVEQICNAAKRVGLPVFATPFDDESLDLLLKMDIPVIKIASGEVTHTPFLARAGSTGRPVILSTGASGLSDVDRAVATLRAAGCPSLSLLHCVSAYPPSDEMMNLRVIRMLQARYTDCCIGLSDHTLGNEAAIAAAALGARIIEKHLTLDRAAVGPDHAASADPPQLAAMIRSLRRVEAMLGVAEKYVSTAECVISRSIVAARNLTAGDQLQLNDLAYKRAGAGIRPYRAAELIGKRLCRAVAYDEQIMLSDIAADNSDQPVHAECAVTTDV